MSQLDNVVITDVTKNNFKRLWPQIVADITNASFIAIDAEMSGLGCTKQTMTSNLDERYAFISSLAASRSIISLGLACFTCFEKNKSVSDKESEMISHRCENKIVYSVSVYNILLLCSDPYIVDPKAVEFLVEHGFNFNKQFAEGISFYRGNDRSHVKQPDICVRNLFCEIIRRRKAIVLHNGFTDLIFMYQSFYAQCPSKLTAFMADLSEIFPSGIYDTKYIAEFVDHTPASFLLYIFKYNVQKNNELLQNDGTSVKLLFESKSNDAMLVSLREEKTSDSNICEKYAAYGWCLNGFHCKKSHNVDAILEFHKTKSSKKRRKKAKPDPEQPTKTFRLSASDSSNTMTGQNFENHAGLIADQTKRMDSEKVAADGGISRVVSKDESHRQTNSSKNSDHGRSSNAKLEIEIISNKHLQKSATSNAFSHNNSLNEIASKGYDCSSEANHQSIVRNDGHRSGIDAFMTGYAFAVFIASNCKSADDLRTSDQKCESYCDSILHLPLKVQKSVVNKLYLSGKNIPLPVCKSEFTKTSKSHNDKIIKVYLK